MDTQSCWYPSHLSRESINELPVNASCLDVTDVCMRWGRSKRESTTLSTRGAAVYSSPTTGLRFNTIAERSTLQISKVIFLVTGGQQAGLTDEELDAMERQTPIEATVVAPSDASEFLLGFAFGFLLGPIAGLCLIETTRSWSLRAGMLMGIVCEVIVALFKMATHVPTGV